MFKSYYFCGKFKVFQLNIYWQNLLLLSLSEIESSLKMINLKFNEWISIFIYLKAYEEMLLDIDDAFLKTTGPNRFSE